MKTNPLYPIGLITAAIAVMIFGVLSVHGEEINILDPDKDGTHHYDEVSSISAEFDTSAGSKYETANGVLWQIWDHTAQAVVVLGSDMDGSDGYTLNMDNFRALGDRDQVNLQALVVNREGAAQSILGSIRSPNMALSTAPDPAPVDPAPVDPTPNPTPDIPEIQVVAGIDPGTGAAFANFIGIGDVGDLADDYLFPISGFQFNFADSNLAQTMADNTAGVQEIRTSWADFQAEWSAARLQLDDLNGTPALVASLQSEVTELREDIAALKTLVEALQSGPVVPDPQPDPNATVNPNTATVEQLDTLHRIGPTLAQRIIDYREANGPYTQASDLVLVRGISGGMVAGFADRLTFANATDQPSSP